MFIELAAGAFLISGAVQHCMQINRMNRAEGKATIITLGGKAVSSAAKVVADFVEGYKEAKAADDAKEQGLYPKDNPAIASEDIRSFIDSLPEDTRQIVLSDLEAKTLPRK